MRILTIKTSQPEAHIALFEVNQPNTNCLQTIKWHAHRQLSETIHKKIKYLLKVHNIDWSDIDGIVVFKGPGSFTGLRIGMSVANALAYSLNVKIVATNGELWQEQGCKRLLQGKGGAVAVPEYGSPARTTTPKK